MENGLNGFDGQQEGCSAVPEAGVSCASPPSGFPCGEWGAGLRGGLPVPPGGSAVAVL